VPREKLSGSLVMRLFDDRVGGRKLIHCLIIG
jgi:hypothetical protein